MVQGGRPCGAAVTSVAVLDWYVRNAVAVLAEVPALSLLTPNPFPEMGWWPVVVRVDRLLVRIATSGGEFRRRMLHFGWRRVWAVRWWVRDVGRFWRLRDR